MSGRWYGSLVNRMQEHNAVTDIKIGDGATLLSYSDRHPATVIEMFSKGKAEYVVVQRDNAKRIDKNGMVSDLGNQEYVYSRNPEGSKSTFKLLPGQPWREVRKNTNGRYIFTEGYGISFGEREEYYDPCF